MYCKKCGHQFAAGATACPACGTKPGESKRVWPTVVLAIISLLSITVAILLVVLVTQMGQILAEHTDRIDELQNQAAEYHDIIASLSDDTDDLINLVDGWDDIITSLYDNSDSGWRDSADNTDNVDDVMDDGLIDVMIDDAWGVVYNGCGYEQTYDDIDAFCVYLDFYNQSGATACYDDMFYVVAFQDGVELEERWLTSSVAYDTTTDVQDGYSATICEAFELRDNSDVCLELHCYIDWSDETVDVMTISLTD